MTIIEMMETPEKYIPDGYYCYNDSGICPFWESKKGKYPAQEDGYCHFLGKSDWEMNEESKGEAKVVYSGDKSLEGKTVSEIFEDDEDIDPISGLPCHFPMSLLWDQCKECSVNEKDDDEELVTSEMELTDASKAIIDSLTAIKKDRK
jgi:hypothetical protein